MGTDAVPEQEKLLEPVEIPAWVWVLLTGSLVIVAISLTARFTVPEDGPLLYWSLAQFAIGSTALLVGHIKAYVHASTAAADLGPFDMVMRPIKVWSHTIRGLPESHRRLRLPTWGITAALCAVFVVGGLSLKQIDELIVMFLPQPPEQSATSLAGGQGGIGRRSGADSLEEAVDELAGTAGSLLEEPMAEEIPHMTCFVIGYTLTVSGDTRSLLLADIEHESPHQFVGKILVEDIDESVVHHVEVMTPKLATPDGSVPCSHRAYWLEPEILCRVEYDEQDEQNLLVGAKVVSIEAQPESDSAGEDDEAVNEPEDADADEVQADSSDESDDPSATDGAQATSSSSSSSSSS